MQNIRRIMWVLLAAIGSVQAATAQQAPSPRPPLAPGLPGEFFGRYPNIITMVPPGLAPRISPQEIRLTNLGDKTLHFAYLIGTDWKSEEIDPGGIKDVRCDQCDKTLKIAYNNGDKDTSTDAEMGSWYSFYWEPSEKHWKLEIDPTFLQERLQGLSKPRIS
jgi:hypothetical protein